MDNQGAFPSVRHFAEFILRYRIPIFLTSLTTGIGFLPLNSSESPPFHALGNIVSMGIIFAFLFSVTTLPALLSLFPMKAKNLTVESEGFMNRIAEFAIKHRHPLGIAFAITLVFTALGHPESIQWPVPGNVRPSIAIS